MNPGNALLDSAENLIRNGAQPICPIHGIHPAIRGSAQKYYFFALLDLRHVGQVDGSHVHGDGSGNADPPILYDHAAFTFESVRISVRITDGKRPDPGRAGTDEPAVVTHRFAGWKPANASNLGFKG